MPNPTDLKTNPAQRPAAPGRVHRKHKRGQEAPAGKPRRGQVPPERCVRCGLTLGPGEPAYLVQDKTVCGGCHATRQASLVAAALAAPRLPTHDDAPSGRRPLWRRAVRGMAGLLWLPLTAVANLSRKNRRRRRQAAVTPLLDQLYRSAHRA